MTTPLPIQPRPPIRGGLASVAAPLGTDDWHSGVEATSSPDDGVFVWDVLCSDEGVELDTLDLIEDDKPISSVGEGYRFYPVLVGKIVECGPAATQTTIGDIARQTARGSIDRQISKALAKALHGALETRGQYAGVNEEGSSLGDLMVVPDGFDPDSPGSIRGTMQGLLDMVCSCSNSDPIFHVPRAWMPHFIGVDLVRWDEGSGKFWFGPHEVSFDCYPNEDPRNIAATNPDGSEVWIFATARPLVAMDEVDEVRVLTRRQNNYQALVERGGIVAFDPTCAWGAKARVC